MIAANVIHSSYRYGVKGLLNLGSSCIYPKFAPQPMKEEHLLTGSLEPTNEPYAIAKISALKLCRYYNEQYGTNYLSGMPTNLYGPGDNFNLETAHVLPALIRKFHLARMLREKKSDEMERDLERFPVGFDLKNSLGLEKLGITAEYVEIWGSGEPYREFLYVDDLAEACIFLMDKCDYREIGEIINIGVGEDMPIKAIAEIVRKITGFQGEIRYDRTKPDGTPRKLLDISRIKALGWTPKTGLEEGIRMTYEWYCKSVQRPEHTTLAAKA
jgi:GDP-L-fucose synthase